MMKHKIPFFTVIAVALVLCPDVSRADDAKDGTVITDQMVNNFYQMSANSMSGSYDEYVAFMNASMADNFQSQANITIRMPGQPPITRKESMSKQSLLTTAKQTYIAMRGAQMDNKVIEILKDPNGKKVAVKDASTVRGMTVPVPDGTPPVEMNGSGTCHDLLKLTDNGTLQIVTSYCDFTYEMQMRQ